MRDIALTAALYAVAVLLPLALLLGIVHWALRRQDLRRLMWRVYLGALGTSELVLLILSVATNPLGSRIGFEGFLFWQFMGPAVVVFGFQDS
jgi:hypothetical protein